MSALSNFHYLYKDHGHAATLVLLHGTGGSEHDLLPLVEQLQDSYNFLGLRGNVSEHGLTRFFERTAAGIFNEQSIREEVVKLVAFLNAWREEHADASERLAFLGYSNGANMILATTFLHPEVVNIAVLLHPMLPLQPQAELELQEKHFVISYGEHDQMISATDSQKVAQILEEKGAEVRIVSHAGGHEIHSEEVLTAHTFLKQVLKHA